MRNSDHLLKSPKFNVNLKNLQILINRKLNCIYLFREVKNKEHSHEDLRNNLI